jgi:hypothetical protein
MNIRGHSVISTMVVFVIMVLAEETVAQRGTPARRYEAPRQVGPPTLPRQRRRP